MNVKLAIVRDEHTATETLGRLYCDGAQVAYTLELPWLNNANNVSCIPKGTYQVVPRFSARFKSHLHVLNVPGRSFILIHPGNTHKDIEGCILPGLKRGKLGGLNAVLSSRKSMAELLAYVSGKEIELIIE
jgi:hypothetical protein